LDILKKLEDSRFNQALKILIIFIFLFGLIRPTDIHLDKEREATEKVNLSTNFSYMFSPKENL